MATDTPHETQLNLGAAALGWVVPGLGQIVIGEKRRGILALIGVLGLFITGLLVGGLDCVDKDEDRLWFAGQVVAGPIAIVAAYGNQVLLKDAGPEQKVPTPPSPAEQAMSSPVRYVSKAKGLAHANEFGTLLCFLAGLMNLVVLMDALVRTPGVCPYERREAPSRRAGEPLMNSLATLFTNVTPTIAWTPFLEPLPHAGRTWWLFLLPLAFLLSMAWKAVRLPRLDHYWRDVFSMTGQIVAAVVGLAVGLYILVIVVMPHLPAE